MLKKKLSLDDIAKQLKVSKTTVSFILNGRSVEKRISDEMTKRVLNYVEEVGYKANAFATSLRTGKTKLIGLIVEDMSNQFFSSVAKSIEDHAFKEGYKVIFNSTYNSPEKTIEIINMLRDRHVDGYIISPPEGVEQEINEMISDKIPVVLFDRYFSSINTDQVVVNNLFSTYSATLHLVGQGYRNIAMLTFNSKQSQMAERCKGYKTALKENNLKPIIKEFSYVKDVKDFLEPLTTFLSKRKDIDAIIFGTNYLGAIALKAMSNLGIRIPDDIAIVAFDDSTVFELHTPQISAIAQPTNQIGGTAMSLLLEQLNDEAKQGIKTCETVPTTLIIRDSSKRKALQEKFVA